MANDGLQSVTNRALVRLRGVCPGGLEVDEERLAEVALASDFAIDTLERQPDLLAWLLADDGASPVPLPVLEAGQKSAWPGLLRSYRQAGSTRLVWRDVLGLDDVSDTLLGTTALAETCLQLGLAALEAEFAERHGVVRAADGSVQRLVVFGLGKLGGGELNFSSDIDLVYAYEQAGESDSTRPLEAADYFARLGQQLAKLLDEVTVDGFCHRVDLRLRPFGSAGRVALSFAAMEQYYQREGRDWERYAWQKARPVAGDIDAGRRLLETLRPFVYRRYLDFGALEGLRTMKASIAAEVARKDRQDDIKLGAGGIREIEFLAQALQLIRGGREPELQERRLVPALRALVAARQMDAADADDLIAAYAFLRRVENRLQMLGDAQTHQLPTDEPTRQRIASGLGFEDWPALLAVLDGHRRRVAEEFGALLTPRERRTEENAFESYWQSLPDGGDAEVLARAGFEDSEALDARLRDFARSPGVQALSDTSWARLQRVIPRLLAAAANASQPDAALRGVLGLLRNVLRRTSYLALLDEEPSAMTRLVGLVSRSAMLAERVAMYPLLLDELLDARIAGPLPGREGLREACEAAVAAAPGDVETALQALNETRHALGFRIGLATLDERQTAGHSARQLAWLADAVVAIVLRLAEADMAQVHGRIEGARFAVLGYGSLGGEELGIGSDLDLVFLYQLPQGSPADIQSNGPRALDAQRWHARLAQKIVSLLGSETGAGKLYEVDVRLRPDGASGLLVSSFDSYASYQRERAWTWEHQALVRARCVAGDGELCAGFDRVRGEVLARQRDEVRLRTDVVEMRARMCTELDRSRGGLFDLKQGEGGLVDLEFLLQFLVLGHASAHPRLLEARATPVLLDTMRSERVLGEEETRRLRAAHVELSAASLQCTLDRRSRIIETNDAVESAREAVRSVAQAHGLDFTTQAVPAG